MSRPESPAALLARRPWGRSGLGLLSLFALAGLAACDSVTTGPDREFEGGAMGTSLTCAVDASAGTFSCEPVSGLASGVAAATIGGQHHFVRLASTNVSTSGGTLSADVTVQNLTLEPLATSDGSTAHPDGVRVFFNSGPTNGVTVANQDGTANFTGTDQPYHQYDESPSRLGGDGILSAATAETSAAKTWEFSLNGAGTFTFTVFVDATVPDASGTTTSLDGLAVGGRHACGRDSGGQAFCWGANDEGQAGDGTTVDRTTPIATDQSVDGGVSFVELEGDGAHSCARTSGGQAYCWGNNASGELGDGSTTDRESPTPVSQDGLSFVGLAAGSVPSCAVTSGGQGYCWGNNLFGQLGDGTVASRSSPTSVSQGPGVAFDRITGGTFHTCGLTGDGDGYCWGSNGDGQVGDGSTSNRSTPVAVDQSVDGGISFAGITAGEDHTCAVTTGDAAYCWGDNATGELGDGSTTGSTTPTAVSGGISFVQITAGANHTCALTSGGQAYCWGENDDGELGDGSTTQRTSPTAVDQSVDGGITFVEIHAGNDHTCGRLSGGRVYCWGDSPEGRLGDGRTTASSTPVPVASTE